MYIGQTKKCRSLKPLKTLSRRNEHAFLQIRVYNYKEDLDVVSPYDLHNQLTLYFVRLAVNICERHHQCCWRAVITLLKEVGLWMIIQLYHH